MCGPSLTVFMPILMQGSNATVINMRFVKHVFVRTHTLIQKVSSKVGMYNTDVDTPPSQQNMSLPVNLIIQAHARI